MKASSLVCTAETTVPGGISGGSNAGRVTSRSKKDVENEEIQMYLSKLKDLVPFMPKNRKLSKLEVIQYVIDYICDLQSALEMHPAVGAFDPAAIALCQKKAPSDMVGARQPLGVRSSPNTILASFDPSILLNSEKFTTDDGHQLSSC